MKTEILKTRINPEEKEIIFSYCAEKEITVSDFIRTTLLTKIKEEQTNERKDNIF